MKNNSVKNPSVAVIGAGMTGILSRPRQKLALTPDNPDLRRVMWPHLLQ